MNLQKHHLWILLRVPTVSSYTLKKNKPFFHMHITIAYCNLPAVNYTWVLWQSTNMYSLNIVVNVLQCCANQSQLPSALKMKFDLGNFTFPVFLMQYVFIHAPNVFILSFSFDFPLQVPDSPLISFSLLSYLF